jgi:hypothetical protein
LLALTEQRNLADAVAVVANARDRIAQLEAERSALTLLTTLAIASKAGRISPAEAQAWLEGHTMDEAPGLLTELRRLLATSSRAVA